MSPTVAKLLVKSESQSIQKKLPQLVLQLVSYTMTMTSILTIAIYKHYYDNYDCLTIPIFWMVVKYGMQ